MAIKRNKYLQPLSREHHHGLLLGWKIRTGIKKNIEPGRIRRYADWFCHHHLVPHFEAEEKYIFPILGNKNELVIRALEEHRNIMNLFANAAATYQNLNKIADELDAHIRFEERVLFNQIQNVASDEQLEQIALLHNETTFADNIADPFWER